MTLLAVRNVVIGLALFGWTIVNAFSGPSRFSHRPFVGTFPVQRPSSRLASDLAEAPEMINTERIPRLGDISGQNQLTNALILGGLFTAAGYGVLHNDLEKLASLAPEADRLKAAVAMLKHLPTEWLAWYDDEALEFPLMTKASTSGVCYFLGDLCAQTVSGKSMVEVKIDRAVRSGAAGFIGHGPIAHYWLNFLDQYLSFDGEWWAVIPKIMIDQGPMSIVYNTIYSLLLGAFAFRDPRAVLSDVRATFFPGFLASIRFWPLVHLVTFSLIPIELQLLWIDAAEIVWVSILSGVNNEGLNEDTAAATDDGTKVLET